MPPGDSEPTKKDVVVALMKFEGRDEAIGTSYAFLTYRCRRPGCTKPSVRFKSGSGYSNPYRHLLSCYARGKPVAEQNLVVNRLYSEAVKARDHFGGSILSHFSINALTELDRTVYGYIRLIVMRSLPVTIKRVSQELEGTRGAVMYDGWVGNSTHYVNVIASYCVDVPKKTKAGIVVQAVTRSTLLGLSSLGQVEDGTHETDASVAAESTKFNAEVHIDFFREVFKFHKLDFDQWCVCLLGDNAAVNLRMARLINKPFVGCSNHKLNLDVNDMVRSSRDLSATIERVHSIMKHVKSSLRNSAMLRNLTDLRPVIHNETRWSGKHSMLKRFQEIQDDLVRVCDADNIDLPDTFGKGLISKVERYEKMLASINVVQVQMQKKKCSLAFCRDALNTLIEAISEEKCQRGSNLFGCLLLPHHIATNAACVKYPIFETAVVKIQKGDEDKMTKEEKESVSSLLRSSAQVEAPESLTRPLTMEERLEKRQKVSRISDYINCDFVLGSIAESERVWSICKYVLSDHRCSLTPQLFEAIIYLRYNDRFWDPQLVAEAVSSTRGTQSSEDQDESMA
eukprot:IDg2072t1